MKYSQQYHEVYQGLPETLAATYTDLRFDNHCYLRIALDNTFGAKWDTVLSRPAYKNLTDEQRTQVLDRLSKYKENKELLLEHNQNSLVWRGKAK